MYEKQQKQTDEQIPHLMPIKRKKIQQQYQLSTPSQKQSINNDTNILIKDLKKNTPTNQFVKSSFKNYNQLHKQGNNDKKQLKDKNKQKILILPKKNNEKDWQKQKQKLKSQKLNSISAKNITQQLYPISNQVLQLCISQIHQQIQKLKIQAQKKQNNLQSNPTNLQFKNQLISIKNQIQHCFKIKQLYYKKLNYRNKIRILQQRILTLENQNNQIRKKVINGIENVQSYKHHMPCDPQKQVQQKLQNCNKQLEKQKKMKQTLLQQGVLQKFDKLYQLAQKARQIAIKKLRQVQQSQKQIKSMKYQQQSQIISSQIYTPKKQPPFQLLQQKKSQPLHTIQPTSPNPSTSLKPTQNDLNKSAYHQKNSSIIPNRQKQQKKNVQFNNNNSINMEDIIKKMRNNQIKLQIPT